jgi:hypothetical protein
MPNTRRFRLLDVERDRVDEMNVVAPLEQGYRMDPCTPTDIEDPGRWWRQEALQQLLRAKEFQTPDRPQALLLTFFLVVRDDFGVE